MDNKKLLIQNRTGSKLKSGDAAAAAVKSKENDWLTQAMKVDKLIRSRLAKAQEESEDD